jgi:hypothetical protein
MKIVEAGWIRWIFEAREVNSEYLNNPGIVDSFTAKRHFD